MLRDFTAFLFAIWMEWAALLTGGSIIAFLAIYNFWTGKTQSRTISLLILGLTLIVAAFLAWRREWVKNGKGFIDTHPKTLTEIVRQRTSVQASSLLKPYFGKRIKITGVYADISYFLFFFSQITFRTDGILVGFMLSRWAAERFVPLSRGARLTVTGRINRIDSFAMQLNAVEILELDDGGVYPTGLTS